jgi:opacity protein-like surface antigen
MLAACPSHSPSTRCTGTIATESRGATHSEFDEPEGGSACRLVQQVKEVQERMKKSKLLFLLLPMMAAASYAQESRQDVSLSGSSLIAPFTHGQGVNQTATLGLGGLVSYRYLLTPRSGLEGNYDYSQATQKYSVPYQGIRVHAREQEFSAAYVYNFTYRNFNPFIEVGVAGFMFNPIDDIKTQSLNVKKATDIGFIYGAGIAYEISPSFDIRVEYRAQVQKTPTLVTTTSPTFSTGQYYNVSNPVIGIAYHF